MNMWAHNKPYRMRPAEQLNLELRHRKDYVLVIKTEQNWPVLKMTEIQIQFISVPK